MDPTYTDAEQRLYHAVYTFYRRYHVLSGRAQTLPDGTPDPEIQYRRTEVMLTKAVVVAASGEARAMEVIGAAHEEADADLDMADIAAERRRWQDLAETGDIRPEHQEEKGS